MKTRLLFFILLASISLVAQAQQNDSVPKANVWTLKQCVDYALANNLTIKRSGYTVAGSEIDYKQSKWALLPNLTGNVSYGFGWGRSLNEVSNDYTTQEQRQLNPGASASMTLFNGLQVQNRIRETAHAYAASEQDLAKTKNDVMLDIASLYISVIFNKEQLENAKFQLASSEAQLDRVHKQVAAGALPRSEELNLDAQAATNEVTVVTQENALNLSLLQLKQALQLPASTPLDVELIDVEIEDLVVEQSRDEIYDLARQTMPEIKSASLKVESAYYSAKVAKGSLYPRLTLGSSINSRYSSVFEQFPPYDGVRGQLRENIGWSLGATLSIPIFNNMQARSNWQQSVINREVAIISAKETENTLRQNVETAYNDAVAAAKTYNSSTRQVQAREEAFRIMEQRYNAGAANSFEYQVSQNDLFRAKTDLTRAKFDFLFKKKVLDFYQGKPLEY